MIFRNYINTFSSVIVLLFSIGVQSLSAQGNCTSGCNNNTFVYSSNPNTLEYDNLVSIFHSTMAKERDGTFKVWGQQSGSDGTSALLTPTVIAPGTGTANFNYTGTILRMAAGSNESNASQFTILTTDGLYVWGTPNTLLSSTIKSSAVFSKITVNGKADGLPPGVNPADVKMMFGSTLTLAIVTCTGDAWVLSAIGSKNGDGTTQDAANNIIWHRVKTNATGNPNLTSVVAVRGTPNALYALTSTGRIYTWGTGTYINSGAAQTRTFATEMSVPTNAVPKMIGMTQNGTAQSYYLLATDGKLYCMGDNSNRQLGDGTLTTRTVWVQPQKITDQNGQGVGNLENVVYISPNEHSTWANSAAINILTGANKLWAWGSNSGNMLGQATSTAYYDTIYMPGQSTATNGLSTTDDVIAVETGGHTTINIKKCSQSYGYVGHKVSGSMGDGTSTNANVATYSYSTSILFVCGTDLGPKIQNLKICQNQTANLNNAVQEQNPSEVEWHVSNDPTSAVITNVSAVGPGTYYAFFTVASGKCRVIGSIVTVAYYAPGDSGIFSCACFNDAATGGTNHDTKFGITLLKRAGVQNTNWPLVRKSGHIALESNTKGFVLTRMTTAQLDAIKSAGNAVEGMISYDTTVNCLKIYSGGDWKCFNIPSCQ
ncbi:hypothetical protein OMO38_19695 [Chryseobacterium sp. 09-1422]|uniref:Ig-like domain-containing protein n=1 Tax=Chryseobacterium kimseyorum TaxID=2984028 RepID=A0ABT3I3V8_9FLAO|nr:hypothetical protein [Chryseobacterium kimseyorum]MCW3170760.1 hypothetical protein [Chryseobacterium kimseyorum]